MIDYHEWRVQWPPPPIHHTSAALPIFVFAAERELHNVKDIRIIIIVMMMIPSQSSQISTLPSLLLLLVRRPHLWAAITSAAVNSRRRHAWGSGRASAPRRRRMEAVGGATGEDVRCPLLMTSIHDPRRLVQFSTSPSLLV